MQFWQCWPKIFQGVAMVSFVTCSTAVDSVTLVDVSGQWVWEENFPQITGNSLGVNRTNWHTVAMANDIMVCTAMAAGLCRRASFENSSSVIDVGTLTVRATVIWATKKVITLVSLKFLCLTLLVLMVRKSVVIANIVEKLSIEPTETEYRGRDLMKYWFTMKRMRNKFGRKETDTAIKTRGTFFQHLPSFICCPVQMKMQRNLKRFLKEIYQMLGWVDRWRHWLTKYTNKESTFHNIATFHTTIPT